MDINLFAAVFALIFTAELPDKTAFATFLMATRGKPLAIFTGVAAAFVVQSFIAVNGGSFVGLLPENGFMPEQGFSSSALLPTHGFSMTRRRTKPKKLRQSYLPALSSGLRSGNPSSSFLSPNGAT